MPGTSVVRLMFVYDADSGRWGAIVDSAKKVLMVKGCALCDLTHGMTGEKREWVTCKDGLGVPVDYLHRDELTNELLQLTQGALPCVVAEDDSGGLSVALSREVLERCRSSFADFRGKLQYHLTSRGLELVSTPKNLP